MAGFSPLNTLGTAAADAVCQAVISQMKPQPPATRDKTLAALGIPDDAAITILVAKLVAATKAQKATLDPATLQDLVPGTTYGTMVDRVADAPLAAA
jgi:hypothetical protein